ncbi:hypothetical protein MMC10_004970 [Thelotrema lepadinum]|nr:hypothetical protein [Thelotrema lepadinum]
MEEGLSNPVFALQSLPGRGLGLIATQEIPKGCRILAEKPIFTMPSQARNNNEAQISAIIVAKLRDVSKDAQRNFFALHNNFVGSLSPFLGIAKTNALPLGVEAVEAGIFHNLSRINHACLPNCQHTWNVRLGKETIHSVRDIAAGEEITISYSDTGPSGERRAHLKRSFLFDCTCGLCSLSEQEQLRSDERLKNIQQLDEMIGDGSHLTMKPQEHLRWVHSLLQLLDAEQIMDARLPRAYYDAFQTVIAQGDQARAKVFADRAYSARLCCEGDDSEATLNMKELANNPGRHRLFGVSNKWRQSVKKIPSGVDGDDFEKWLWRQNM